MYSKKCEKCGKEFESEKRKTRTCSKNCGSLLRRKPKIVIKCASCGNNFEVRPSDKKRKFCTRKCMVKDRNCICEICGVKFLDIRFKKKRRFCSQPCRYKSMIGVPKNFTHKMSRTSEWKTWNSLKRRCSDPKEDSFQYYGGRGISVCARWLECFENFFADMGHKPSKKHSIDRIDYNGNYEPSNCRWATAVEQANNKSNNITFVYKGKFYTSLAVLGRELGLSDKTDYTGLAARYRETKNIDYAVERTLNVIIRRRNSGTIKK